MSALFHVEDILERASIPFCVIGDTAYQIKNQLQLQVHRITVGVLKQHAVQECTSLIKVIDPSVEAQTDGFKLMHRNVPVFIKILTKDYHTLLDPDIVFYNYGTFRLPNPFEKYWAQPDHLDS